MHIMILLVLRRLAKTGALLLLLCCFSSAQATPICVNTNNELQNALSIATVVNTPYTIQLVQHTYTLPPTGKEFLQPITIEGGYTDATCTTRQINASNTIIDMSGNQLDLRQGSGSPTGLIKIEGLTLKNGINLMLWSGNFGSFSDYAGAVRLSHVRITNFSNTDSSINPALRDYPVHLVSYAADVTLEPDSVTFPNHSAPPHFACPVRAECGDVRGA